MQQSNFVADRHPCGAAHDHPVLRAVMMLLQGEAAAGAHDDALDLVA